MGLLRNAGEEAIVARHLGEDVVVKVGEEEGDASLQTVVRRVGVGCVGGDVVDPSRAPGGCRRGRVLLISSGISCEGIGRDGGAV